MSDYRVLVNRKYKHYKGGVYTVLHLAISGHAIEPNTVVYRSESSGLTYVRPIGEWDDPVLDYLRFTLRFTLMEEGLNYGE